MFLCGGFLLAWPILGSLRVSFLSIPLYSVPALLFSIGPGGQGLRGKSLAAVPDQGSIQAALIPPIPCLKDSGSQPMPSGRSHPLWGRPPTGSCPEAGYLHPHPPPKTIISLGGYGLHSKGETGWTGIPYFCLEVGGT